MTTERSHETAEPVSLSDGARVALVIDSEDGAGRLLTSGWLPPQGRRREITVIAIPPWKPMALASIGAGVSTAAALTRSSGIDAAVCAARRVANGLPADIAVRHLAYRGWSDARFLSTLRSGAFDVLLLAASPPLWPGRFAFGRAARRGDVVIISLRSQPTRRRLRRAATQPPRRRGRDNEPGPQEGVSVQAGRSRGGDPGLDA